MLKELTRNVKGTSLGEKEKAMTLKTWKFWNEKGKGKHTIKIRNHPCMNLVGRFKDESSEIHNIYKYPQ